tara:strand:+ start:4433 stop:4795 length:363 start_codon:yes stop_codon:yes gene_type:complete
MNKEKGVKMPFNRRQADNQLAAQANPGVTPARNNRMVPPAPPISAVPNATPSAVPQATPTSIPNVPGAGMTPQPIVPSPGNVPIQPNQLNNITAATNRNGVDGMPPQGPRFPMIRNKRIV